MLDRRDKNYVSQTFITTKNFRNIFYFLFFYVLFLCSRSTINWLNFVFGREELITISTNTSYSSDLSFVFTTKV